MATFNKGNLLTYFSLLPRDATLLRHMVWLCPCPCLSVRYKGSEALSKRLNIVKLTVPHDSLGVWFSVAKDLDALVTDIPSGAPNTTGEENLRLSTITRYMPKTVQDRRVVSMKGNRKSYALCLEWTQWPQIFPIFTFMSLERMQRDISDLVYAHWPLWVPASA